MPAGEHSRRRTQVARAARPLAASLALVLLFPALVACHGKKPEATAVVAPRQVSALGRVEPESKIRRVSVPSSLSGDRIEKLLTFLAREIAALASPEEKLRRIIELQLGLLDGERELAEVVTIIVRQSNTLLREHAAPKFLAYLDAIASVVAEGQRQGTFRSDVSPHLVARAVFGALDGIALTWALGKPEVGALKRSASQLSALILGGIRANQPGTP